MHLWSDERNAVRRVLDAELKSHAKSKALSFFYSGSRRGGSPAYGLNRDAAKWQLYELDGCSETFERANCGDSGNIVTRLVRAVDIAAAFTRFAASITCIQSSRPNARSTSTPRARSSCVCMVWEFVRACMEAIAGSFRNDKAITFGLSQAEYTLGQSNEAGLRDLATRLPKSARRMAHAAIR